MKKSKILKTLITLPSIAVLPLLPVVSAQSENNNELIEFKQKIVALKDLTEKLKNSFTSIYHYLIENNYPFQKHDPNNRNVKSLENLNKSNGYIDSVYKLIKKLSDANFDTKEQYFKLAAENGFGKVASEEILFKYLENWISNYVIRNYDVAYDNYYMNFQINKLVEITKNPEVGTFLREHMMTDYEAKSDAFEKAFAAKIANNTFTAEEAQSFVLDLLVIMNENVGKYIREIREKYYKSLTTTQDNSLDSKVNEYSNNTTDKIANDDVILQNIYSLYNTMNQAGQLNETMTVLRDTIEKAKKELGTINYTEATNEPSDPIKDNFSNILDEASKVINGDGNSDTEQQINELITKLTVAQEKLDGKEQISKTITNQIDNSTGDSEVVKDKYKKYLGEISSDSKKLKELHDYFDLLQKAQELVKRAKEIQKTVNYTQASAKPNKSNFNRVLKSLEYNINRSYMEESPWPIEDADGDSLIVQNDLTNIQGNLTELNKAIEHLNGNQNLTSAKEDATNAINQLSELEKTQKDEYLKQVASLEDVEKINEVKATAEKANEEIILNKAKEAATSYINGLEYLSPEQKNTYIDQIKQVNNKDNLEPIKTAANSANETAKALANKKQEATSEINGLQALTSEQRNAYVSKINEADNTQKVDEVLKEAKEANTQAQQLATAKENAIKELKNLSYLSKDQVTNFTKNINEALDTQTVENVLQEAQNQNETAKNLAEAKSVAKTNISNLQNLPQDKKVSYTQEIEQAENENAVQAIVNKATAENTSNKELSDKKQSANETIGGLTSLSEEQKQDYKEKINKANDKGTVETLVNQAKEENSVAEKLATKKKEATETIKELGSLTDGEKSDYVSQINGATDINQIDPIVNNAKEKNTSNKALADKKQDANAKIDSLTSLSEEQRADYKEQINNQNNLTDIDQIVNTATAANTTAKELADKKNEAKKTVNGLMSLTPEQRKTYTDKIDAAANKEDIDPIVAEATSTNSANELANKKTEADKKIDALTSLGEEQRADFKKQISNQNNSADIDEIVNTATEANTTAQELANKKQEAITTINSLTSLTEDKRNEYISQINGATDISQIDPIVTKATNENTFNKELSDDKQDAANAINELTLLTEEQKKGYIEQVNEATTPEGVGEVVRKATALNTAIEDLNNQKNNASETIGNMSGLTQDQIQSYISQVNQASNETEINNIVKEAQKVNDAAIKLANEKAAALQKLNDMTYIGEFLSIYQGEINNAQDSQTIQDVLAKAEEANKNAEKVFNAASDAQNKINALEHLSNYEKQNFINNLWTAKSVEQVSEILKQAIEQNKANEELQKAKDNAISSIKKLTYLSEEGMQSFIGLVQIATTVPAVQNALDQAVSLNQAKQQYEETQDAIKKASEKINDFSYLSDNLKNQLLENLKLSRTTEEVSQNLNSVIKLNKDAETLVNAINEFDLNVKESSNVLNSNLTAKEKELEEINNQMVIDSKLNVGYTDQQVLDQIKKLSSFKTKIDNAKSWIESSREQFIMIMKYLDQELNKAQIDKFVEEIENSYSGKDMNNITTAAQNLNNAMFDLIKANNENKELLKDLNFGFCNLDSLNTLKANQEIIDKLVDLEKGIIYKDNTAASVNELMTQTNTLVQNIIKNVTDNETAKTNFINPMQEKLDNYNNLLTSNKFFNAPNAMLTHLRELVTSFENQLNIIANNNKYLTQEEMDTLNSATSGIDSLVDDLSHFSDKVFTNSIGQRIKEFTSWVETNMLHTSDQYQENALNTYNNSMSYAEAVAAKQNSETNYNNLMNNWKVVEDKIADAIKTMTYTNTIENDIKQLIGLNDNIYSDLNTLNNTTKVLAELNDVYQAFLKTNATKKFAFLDAKHNLASKLNTHIVETARSSEMSTLITEADTKFAQTLNDAKLIFKLASALENRNEEAFQKAMSSLTSNTNISNFAKLLVQNNYFNDVKVAESSSNAVKELHNIFNSQDFKDAPKVLQTLAMINVVENKEAFPWWTCLLIFGALIFLGGILTYIFKNK
ncbi:rhoptry family protein [Mycoplasma sp. VS31B]